MNGKVILVLYLGFEVPQYFSDYYLQDASFLRFDHITLGYNFNNLFNEKISRLKLFVTVQNPLVISKYDGVDGITGDRTGGEYIRIELLAIVE